jgi:hypothetical protein
VAELLHTHVAASDRSIAAAAGVSPGTVRDVRRRLRQGEGLGTEPMRRPQLSLSSPPVAPGEAIDLRTDAQLCDFAQWMEVHNITGDECERWVETIPLSRIYVVSDEARRQANLWAAFADAVEARATNRPQRGRRYGT